MAHRVLSVCGWCLADVPNTGELDRSCKFCGQAPTVLLDLELVLEDVAGSEADFLASVPIESGPLALTTAA